LGIGAEGGGRGNDAETRGHGDAETRGRGDYPRVARRLSLTPRPSPLVPRPSPLAPRPSPLIPNPYFPPLKTKITSAVNIPCVQHFDGTFERLRCCTSRQLVCRLPLAILPIVRKFIQLVRYVLHMVFPWSQNGLPGVPKVGEISGFLSASPGKYDTSVN
jgi:hypothetical protein